ncbi:G-protein coupled receptor Mth2-like [Cloeon dipterum]|uniref:G-protein coupled receptor Mth2-like n=1 Tax=Cloeon dipterum TaxID=197152 RepID=UPI0032209035
MCADSGTGRPKKEIHHYIYPVFMIFSIICLLLTLLAFVFTPEMRNLHGKSIACQSFTLMMAYIGLTITYFSGTDSNLVVCKLFAYMSFGFLLSSFYWLNTMCFDIFWTFSDFKKMTGSLSQSSNKKFRMYAIYSTLIPLIVITVTIILDAALDEKSFMWPGIGKVKCWFRNKKTEFIFFHSHLLIMLLANTVFFILTLVKITNMKREVQVLKRGDSMTHAAGASSALEDRQRFVLYVKLFILMGGTWVLELISWAVNSKPKWFWIPFDVINCSRGIIIFIFCVVTNQKVRNSLLRRFLPKYAPDPSLYEPRSCQSKMSATSELSDTHDTICTTTALCSTKSTDTE